MALLSIADRAEVTAVVQRRMLTAFGGLSKPQLRAAIDATDQWIEDNSAAFNTALPVAARAALSAAEKTQLFCYVALKRAGLL